MASVTPRRNKDGNMMPEKLSLETYLNSYLEFCAGRIVTPEGMVTLRGNVAEALADHDAEVRKEALREAIAVITRDLLASPLVYTSPAVREVVQAVATIRAPLMGATDG